LTLVELVVSLLLLNGLSAIFAEEGGRVLDEVIPFVAGVESWVLNWLVSSGGGRVGLEVLSGIRTEFHTT
jgi:hypothetical protein